MRIKHDGPFCLENATRYTFGKHRVYGGSDGGATPTSSVTTPTIPAELKPLAELYTQQATNISQTPYQSYTDPRYADLTNTQNLGLDMVTDRAVNGSETMNAAEGSLNQFIQGGQTNPYLDSLVADAQGSVVDQFNNMTKPQTEAAMQQSGSFGNSGYNQLMQSQQKAATDQMSDIATQMYGDAYNTDKANQMTAIGMAPTFGNAAYDDAAQLMNAGGVEQLQSQNNLDFDYEQFQNAADYPFKQLSATSGVLDSNMGSSTEGLSSSGGK